MMLDILEGDSAAARESQAKLRSTLRPETYRLLFP
jgi:hypothetical protein